MTAGKRHSSPHHVYSQDTESDESLCLVQLFLFIQVMAEAQGMASISHIGVSLLVLTHLI